MPSSLPHTLICTIGTSLIYPNLANLPNNEETYAKWLEKQPQEDQENLSLNLVLDLQASSQANDSESVALALGQLSGTTRLCGAVRCTPLSRQLG